MNPVIAELQGREDEYGNLPEAIKLVYSAKEYLWLSDAEKVTLVQRECEPDA